MSSPESFFSFIKSKMKTMNAKTILFNQVEAFLWWIVGYLPGLPGMFIRDLVLRILFKEKQGMSWVQHHVTLVHTNRMKSGRNLGINSGSYINALGGITFGNDVLIGSNCTISAGKHPTDGREASVFSRASIPMPIIFEDDVWLAAGVVILPGITLGKGTVVGANSVVTKSTEPYSIMVGAPARMVKKR